MPVSPDTYGHNPKVIYSMTREGLQVISPDDASLVAEANLLPFDAPNDRQKKGQEGETA
ncbi:hypothetical protein BaRGS_00010494, partial [Batillaria attramentaria]